MPKPLVPNNFPVPNDFRHTLFTLRPLTINDLEKDYAAVMSSIDRIHGVLGPECDWPPAGLTLEQDLIDLGWHQREFQTRRSFAYTVMQPDESVCLGCVYIYHSEVGEFDAMVVMWVSNAAYKQGLDDVLYNSVKTWLAEEWPFNSVAYPGRDHDWSVCNSL